MNAFVKNGFSLIVLLLFSVSGFAASDANIAKIDKYLDGIIANGPPADTAYPKEMKPALLDLEEQLKTDYPSGIAYGAIVSKTIPVSSSEIKKILAAPGGIFRQVSAVKTQRNFTKIEEKPNFLNVKLAIKVPVFSDILTQDIISLKETPKGVGIMEWRQTGEAGDLAYNRGLFVITPDGDKSKVFVVGIHILKPERKIPWVGRATASNFAKTHYAGYISAVESLSPK
jgi:hypothetical protein